MFGCTACAGLDAVWLNISYLSFFFGLLVDSCYFSHSHCGTKPCSTHTNMKERWNMQKQTFRRSSVAPSKLWEHFIIQGVNLTSSWAPSAYSTYSNHKRSNRMFFMLFLFSDSYSICNIPPWWKVVLLVLPSSTLAVPSQTFYSFWWAVSFNSLQVRQTASEKPAQEPKEQMVDVESFYKRCNAAVPSGRLVSSMLSSFWHPFTIVVAKASLYILSGFWMSEIHCLLAWKLLWVISHIDCFKRQNAWIF